MRLDLKEIKMNPEQSLTLEGLPAAAAIEIAVVECDAAMGADYNAKRAEMLRHLELQQGFLGWRGFESTARPGVMLDILYWEKAENCHAAGKAMQALPAAQEFFSMIKQTLMFETFRRQM